MSEPWQYVTENMLFHKLHMLFNKLHMSAHILYQSVYCIMSSAEIKAHITSGAFLNAKMIVWVEL